MKSKANKKIMIIFLMAFLSFVFETAAVQAHDSKNPIHVAMISLGKNLKEVGTELKLGRITENMKVKAEEIFATAKTIPVLFSQTVQTKDSRAKPEIWTDATGFRKANNALLESVLALKKSLNGNDIDRVKKTWRETGKNCSSCHKIYRLPKK